MSYRLLLINTMYEGFINDVYKNNKSLKEQSYRGQLEYLIENSTDTVASQTRSFRGLGIETECIVINAKKLQSTWQKENNFNSSDKFLLVLEQIKMINPGLIFISNREFFNREWLLRLRKELPGLKLIFGSHCAPFNKNDLKNLGNLDFVLTCTPGLNNDFKKYGLSSYLVYHGVDEGIINKVISKQNKYDLTFSGSLYLGGGYHDNRLNYIEEIVKNDINIDIFGNIESFGKIILKRLFYDTNRVAKKMGLGKIYSRLPIVSGYSEYLNSKVKFYSKDLIKKVKPPVFGRNMYQLLSDSKINLNIHGDIANRFAGNLRLFEATGLGACLLTDNKENLGELFEIGKEVVAFDNIPDCIEKIHWLLGNDKKRIEIARAGKERTLKGHTINNRCKAILEIINNEIKN